MGWKMFFVGGVLISVFGVYVYGSFTTREAPFTHPVVPYTAPVLVVLDILYKYHSLGAITLACFLFTSKVLGGRFSGETFMILLLCSAFVKGEKKNERRED